MPTGLYPTDHIKLKYSKVQKIILFNVLSTTIIEMYK